MEVKQDGNRTTLHLRHLDSYHLTGKGEINPISVLKLFEFALQFGILAQERICHENNENSDLTCLLRWQQIEFSSNFGTITKSLSQPHKLLDILNQKIDIVHISAHTGNSSQMYESVMKDSMNRILVYVKGRYVNADPATGKSKPFPQCVRDLCNANQVKNFKHWHQHMPERCTQNYDKPEDVVFYRRKSPVCATMVDLHHLNHTSYVLICLECLEHGLRDGFAKHSNVSIWNYQIRRVSSLYMKECSLGDEVETTVWQNSSNFLVFHFHIDKNGRKVFQAEVEFFSAAVSPKL